MTKLLLRAAPVCNPLKAFNANRCNELRCISLFTNLELLRSVDPIILVVADLTELPDKVSPGQTSAFAQSDPSSLFTNKKNHPVAYLGNVRGSWHTYQLSFRPNGRTGALAARPRAAAPGRTGRDGFLRKIFSCLTTNKIN